jgi:hypothetical protein
MEHKFVEVEIKSFFQNDEDGWVQKIKENVYWAESKNSPYDYHSKTCPCGKGTY